MVWLLLPHSLPPLYEIVLMQYGEQICDKNSCTKTSSVLQPRDLPFVFLVPTIHSLHTLFFGPFSLFLNFLILRGKCDKELSVITNPHLSAGRLPYSYINLCTRVCLLFLQLPLFGITHLLYGFLRKLAEK